MFRALASVLLLGVFPQTDDLPTVAALPGVEQVQVAAPEHASTYFVKPSVHASGALLIDLDSAQMIFGQNADMQHPMGSLTKLMTAIILTENHDLDEIVTISPIAAEQGGSRIGVEAGQRFVLRDLLRALLISSANDVAYALAIHHSGSVTAFVEEMNKRAATLGLDNTRFNNPAGFDSINQYSSPRDLSTLATAALRKPVLKKIVATRYMKIGSLDGKTYELQNTNAMLHSNANVFGMKTGTTPGAGQCLITLFTEDKRNYMLVILGSDDRYGDALHVMRALRDTELARERDKEELYSAH